MTIKRNSKLKRLISNKKARVAVFGLGYVGLPLSILIAESGFKTYGGDISEKKLDLLNNYQNPLPELNEIIPEKLKKVGYFNVKEELPDTEIKIICVPTPMFTDRRPDLSYIRSITKSIASILKKGDLVINESTVAPGMTRKVIGKILEEESGLMPGKDLYLVASPERIDPGNQIHKLKDTPKVVGGFDKESLKFGKLFYSKCIRKIIPVSSLEAAEATKMLENSYRALNIGFINEFAMFCRAAGIDVLEVISAASTKWSFQPHYPGIGVGGPCIPKDPYYLISASEEAGVGLHTLWNAMLANERMPYFTFKLLEEACKNHSIKIKKAKIVIFGISYKGDVRDHRDSSALVLYNILEREGYNVSVFDPLFSEEELKNLGLKVLNPKNDQCDVAVIGCDHSYFKTMNYKNIKGLKLVIDGKNMLNKLHVPVIGIGREIK